MAPAVIPIVMAAAKGGAAITAAGLGKAAALGAATAVGATIARTALGAVVQRGAVAAGGAVLGGAAAAALPWIMGGLAVWQLGKLGYSLLCDDDDKK